MNKFKFEVPGPTCHSAMKDLPEALRLIVDYYHDYKGPVLFDPDAVVRQGTILVFLATEYEEEGWEITSEIPDLVEVVGRGKTAEEAVQDLRGVLTAFMDACWIEEKEIDISDLSM